MVMNYSYKRFIAFCAVVLLINDTSLLGIITSYSRSDPYPLFMTLDHDIFLETRERLRLKGFEVEKEYNEVFGFSITPFAQNSNSTRTDCLVTPPFIESPCPLTCTDVDTCLGNIDGRWAMIGLLLGDVPEGCALAPALGEAIIALSTVPDCSTPLVLNQQYIDREQNIGFFDVPMRYKKRGIRFDFKGMITCNAGLSFNFGLADIGQTIGFFDRTTPKSGCHKINSCVDIDLCTLERTLMEKLPEIAQQIGLRLGNFQKFSVEDLRAGIFWRRAFDINTNKRHWEQFLLIPFLHIEGSFPVGAKRDYQKFTSLAFGSNDHFGFGFTTGLDIDFTKTIEIGGQFGCTQFFKRDVCSLAIPTSKYQSGIFPFRAPVTIKPGRNWHFGLKMQAYHFLGDLSFYFQYILVDHHKDEITLHKPDPAFMPHLLEKISAWKAQYANIGFNYDISPDISLGFLWQTPFPSNNTYRATTVMLGFNAQF